VPSADADASDIDLIESLATTYAAVRTLSNLATETTSSWRALWRQHPGRNGDNIVLGDSGRITAATVDSATQLHFDGQPITLGRIETITDADAVRQHPDADRLRHRAGRPWRRHADGELDRDAGSAGIVGSGQRQHRAGRHGLHRLRRRPRSGRCEPGRHRRHPQHLDGCDGRRGCRAERSHHRRWRCGHDRVGRRRRHHPGRALWRQHPGRNGDNLVFGDSGHILAATKDSASQAHFGASRSRWVASRRSPTPTAVPTAS